MNEAELVLEVRVANCHLCDSEHAVRGVTAPPHLGSVHMCGAVSAAHGAGPGLDAARGEGGQAVKLRCAKCGRAVSVRERDVREVGASIQPRGSSDSFICGRSLACPFCAAERGGMYHLALPEQGDGA